MGFFNLYIENFKDDGTIIRKSDTTPSFFVDYIPGSAFSQGDSSLARHREELKRKILAGKK